MPRVAGFIKDLIFVAKIREITTHSDAEFISAKNEEELRSLIDSKPQILVVNLSVATPIILTDCRQAIANGISVLAYAPHVDEAAFERAADAGITDVFPRSKICDQLQRALTR